MNTQEELLKETDKKEDAKQQNKVKELSRQYQNGELSKMDVLMAIRELLVNLN